MLRATRLAVAALALTLAAAAAAAPRYVATPLGTLGGPSGQGFAINQGGQITGRAQLASGDWHAFLYGDGRMQDLDTTGGTGSVGYAINAHGHVTGCASGDGRYYGFVHYGDVMADLRVLAGDIHLLCGRGIDDAGRVVGSRWHDFQYSVAPSFLYDAGALREVPQTAMALNNRGDMAGTAYYHVNAPRAWVVVAGVGHSFGDWGDPESWATAINEHGEATVMQGCCAFVYSAGTLTDVGTLASGSWTSGSGINNRGDVVGTSDGRAFLYTGGAMHDLNALVTTGLDGESLTDAAGINDGGSIVANSCRQGPSSSPSCRVFRLDSLADSGTPIPTLSPWTLGALALALLGAGAIVTRRRVA